MRRKIEDVLNNMVLCGRCAVYDGKLNMDWVGSGFECHFIGDMIRIFFDTQAENNVIYVIAEIDDMKFKFSVSGPEDVLVIDGLEFKEHRFKLLRVTEIYTPIDNITDYLFVTDIDVGSNGKLCECKKHEKRMIIDFYGDSITNGWASLAEPGDTSRKHCNNDYTVSYAYLTAEELNADARVCAVSGHGIVSDCEGNRNEPMKLYYKMKSRYLPIEMIFDKKPDIIVVALGTNDCGAEIDEDELKSGMCEYIEMLRADVPNVEIVWIYGMMNERYVPMMTDLFEELKKEDKHIGFLLIESIHKHTNEGGGFGHPNRKGQRRIADELVKYIKRKLYNEG